MECVFQSILPCFTCCLFEEITSVTSGYSCNVRHELVIWSHTTLDHEKLDFYHKMSNEYFVRVL